MRLYTSTDRHARSDTRKQPVHYDFRVCRGVQPGQPELEKPLSQLHEHTANFVQYKSLGKLGLTLLMLEPVLREILPRNRNGMIPPDGVRTFEDELRQSLHTAQYENYGGIRLDPVAPLALYGRHKNRLGLRLQKDYRLVGDRAVVEEYILDNYTTTEGHDVSKRFLANTLTPIAPHITIGTVLYEHLTPEQGQALQDDPTWFVHSEAYASMEAQRLEYDFVSDKLANPGPPPLVEHICLPESLSLSALSVVCRPR